MPDLVTAALAHQHGCGVVHVDDDFDLLARRSGLEFEQRRIALPGDRSGGETGRPLANKQRALKQELSRLLHRKPVAEAQQILERVVRELREGDSG